MPNHPGTINLEPNSNSSIITDQNTSQASEIQIDPEDVKRAAALLIDAEYTIEETIQSFVKRGYSEDKATMIVAYATQVSKTVAKKKSGAGTTNIIIGVVLLVLGIGLTASGIGRIFYGAIIVGIVKIIQGIAATSDSD